MMLAAGAAGAWLCSYRDCHHLAVCEVHAQWSIVDFDDWPSCAQHDEHLVRIAAARLVDGEPPVDVWRTWWEPA